LNKNISNDLVAILRKLLKKETLTFDELTNLSANEKEILHKVVKLCVLDVSVPKPESELLQEKDLQRFEILKGEIGAGNDNAKIVKEFKVLLMKLVNMNRVSRKEAHDILTDLAANGL
jgi:Holliday junction resolvasome RuvABC ATP-dependent DNA helicase subunit